jgi:hypothetical protein
MASTVKVQMTLWLPARLEKLEAAIEDKSKSGLADRIAAAERQIELLDARTHFQTHEEYDDGGEEADDEEPDQDLGRLEERLLRLEFALGDGGRSGALLPRIEAAEDLLEELAGEDGLADKIETLRGAAHDAAERIDMLDAAVSDVQVTSVCPGI